MRTVPVTCTAIDQSGNPVAGGKFRFVLTNTDIDNALVSPEAVEGFANNQGVLVINLWPNALGEKSSGYRVQCWNPDTGKKYLDTTAVVPNTPCRLEDIINLEPFPAVDSALYALAEVQSIQAEINATANQAQASQVAASSAANTANQHAVTAGNERAAAAASAAAASQSVAQAAAISETGLPSQAGNTGKVLKTNGTNTFWGDAATVCLAGDTATYVNQVKTFTITNFNAFSTYTIATNRGTVSLAGDTVTYTAPATTGAATITITMDGASNVFALNILAAGVVTPTVTTPTTGATGIGDTPTATSSAFAWTGAADTHVSSDWQLSTNAGFTAVVQSVTASTTHRTSWPLSGLTVNTTYFLRVRHLGAGYGMSAWSPVISFTTASSFASFIPAPAATPANFGDPLEGGFYAGMIWHEIAQSSTSTAIGTGTRTFTVPNMEGAPIVYAGQMVEVRSRANPANRMAGTVAGAGGTSLSINVTTITGSGTFSDWSVMARHRIIVAPKASGESAGLSYKRSNSAAPPECATVTEGRRATLAMVADGIYPAATFCGSLNIGGRTDWYLPARDELELCWRNLKPTTDNNYAFADRQTGASVSYQTLGSFGDTSNGQGVNANSAPVGAAYTSTVPGRTANAAFHTGGSEAFAYGADGYWSSSEYSNIGAWFQEFSSGVAGVQNERSKTSNFRVRAVRRSII